MKQVPELEHILLRGPRTDKNGNKIPVTVSMVKASNTDLSGHSFLHSWHTYEEWVPTEELGLYKMAKGIKE